MRKVTTCSNGPAAATLPRMQHPPSQRTSKGFTLRSRRPHFLLRNGLVSAEPPVMIRSAPRPHSGSCGFVFLPVPLHLNLSVALPLCRPFTAVLPPSRLACGALLRQHSGPIGLICKPDDDPSRETCGLVPGSPKASSRQSSFGRGGDYKGSPRSPSWRCQDNCRAGTA